MTKKLFKIIIFMTIVTLITSQLFVFAYDGGNEKFNINSNILKNMTTQEKINLLNATSLEEFKCNYKKYEKLIRSIEDDLGIDNNERFNLKDPTILNRDIDSDPYSDVLDIDINVIKKYKPTQQYEDKNDSPIQTSVPYSYDMSDYFESWTKITRDGLLSFSLDPKLATRTFRPTAEEGWSAFYERYYTDSDFFNDGGLEDQYYCHFDFGTFRDYWNLEPSRPDVSYTDTVLALCNP